MKVAVVDCRTREVLVRDVTQEELLAREDEQAAEAERLAGLPPDPDQTLANAIEAATTLAGLKAALLGASGKSAAKGRPVE